MTNVPAGQLEPEFRCASRARASLRAALALIALALLATWLPAQSSPQVSGVDPMMGKVNDTITVSGMNLGKASVSAVFLSDDKDDYKASIVDQAYNKIVMKVPEVKPGSYNISVQVGSNIFIKPVRFSVQE